MALHDSILQVFDGNLTQKFYIWHCLGSFFKEVKYLLCFAIVQLGCAVLYTSGGTLHCWEVTYDGLTLKDETCF